MRRGRARRGYSIIEGLAVAVLLSFAVAATATLMNAGQRQQRLARSYSQVQTDLREALRRATRGMRHGYRVVGTSGEANFSSAPTSGSSQVIIDMASTGGSRLEARYHLTNGTFYVQRATEVAPGTALITGVTGLTFSYHRSIGSVRASVDSAPSTATEVRVRLTARYGSALTPVEAMVNLRNGLTASL